MKKRKLPSAKKRKLPSAKTLARSFTAVLRCTLSPEDMKRIVERNDSEDNPYICHSHDFCDANMVMHAAVLCHGFTNDGVFENHDGRALRSVPLINRINKAWDIAKKNRFELDGDAVGEGWS